LRGTQREVPDFRREITLWVANLQVKIIPTSAAAVEEKTKWSLVRRGEFFVYFFVSRQKSEWVWAKPSKNNSIILFEGESK
jgi:hypothetical protein